MALFASSSEIAALHRDLIACLAFALVALACGNTASDSGGSGGGGAAGSVGQGGTGASASPDFTGVWKGYVDGYAFDDGSNSVTLTLDSVEPEVFGHVRFGEDDLLPAPTDPDVGYPPAISNKIQGGVPSVVSGFVYTLENASFDGHRLKFQVLSSELWNEWCALQTPVLDEPTGNYWCVHNWGFSTGGVSGCTQKDPETGESLDVNCSKVQLCDFAGVCVCDSESCTGRATLGGPTLAIDLVPPNADGDVGGLGAWVHQVHLVKD
jgi:hypothetical protein